MADYTKLKDLKPGEVVIDTEGDEEDFVAVHVKVPVAVHAGVSCGHTWLVYRGTTGPLTVGHPTGRYWFDVVYHRDFGVLTSYNERDRKVVQEGGLRLVNVVSGTIWMLHPRSIRGAWNDDYDWHMVGCSL